MATNSGSTLAMHSKNSCLITYLCRSRESHMHKSTITIDVEMDDTRVPETICWNASDTTADKKQKAKAMMLSFWDGSEKTAMRIDLWTNNMMLDEMADFFYQTIMTMADTYGRATRNNEMVEDMKKFAKEFYGKFKSQQLIESKK
jgi:gliding motility-associated protein GldC